jgi:hypothetical protein
MVEIKREWVNNLSPTEPDRQIEPASVATLNKVTGILSPNAIRWAVETAHEMTSYILEEMSEFGPGDGAFQTVRTATESHLLTATLLLALDDPTVASVTPETVIADHDFVRRGIALNTVLRGVQFGHAFALRRFLDVCEQHVPPRDRANEMRQSTELMLKFFDVFSDQVAREYLEERDRWVSTAAATRKEVVRAILADEPVDLTTAENALGYALGPTHLAFIFESDRPASADPGELQRTALSLLELVHCRGRLIVPVGANTVWAWGTATSTSTPAQIGSYPAPDAIRVGVGVPAPGVTGFVRSHQQAEHAIRLSRHGARGGTGHRADWLIDYATHGIAALMSLDLAMAHDFVRRELAGLAGVGPGNRDLRETLLAYLDEERSVNAVAKRLHVARNTVSYRVKKAEGLLGRTVAERQLELHVALRLERCIGSFDPDAPTHEREDRDKVHRP